MSALVLAVTPVAVGHLATTRPAGTLQVAVVQGGGPRGTRAVFTNTDDVTGRQLAVADVSSPDRPTAVPDLGCVAVVDEDGRARHAEPAGQSYVAVP